VEEEWTTERAVGLFVGTRAQESPEGKFEMPGGASARTTHEGVRDFLRTLVARWPRFAPITPHEAAVSLELLRAGVVEVRSHPGIAGPAGERPQASPLARYQAQCGDSRVTTLDHHNIEVGDQRARDFLMLLDGTRDRAALAAAMACPAEQVDQRLVALERLAVLLDRG
jgi:hypothetical protein